MNNGNVAQWLSTHGKHMSGGGFEPRRSLRRGPQRARCIALRQPANQGEVAQCRAPNGCRFGGAERGSEVQFLPSPFARVAQYALRGWSERRMDNPEVAVFESSHVRLRGVDQQVRGKAAESWLKRSPAFRRAIRL